METEYIAVFMKERTLILKYTLLAVEIRYKKMLSTLLPACVTYFGGECSYVIGLQ
jgi:hypothetical protein